MHVAIELCSLLWLSFEKLDRVLKFVIEDEFKDRANLADSDDAIYFVLQCVD
jgi:hypothetical protein